MLNQLIATLFRVTAAARRHAWFGACAHAGTLPSADEITAQYAELGLEQRLLPVSTTYVVDAVDAVRTPLDSFQELRSALVELDPKAALADACRSS